MDAEDEDYHRCNFYSQVLPEYVGRNRRNCPWVCQQNAHEIVHRTRNLESIVGLLKHFWPISGQMEAFWEDFGPIFGLFEGCKGLLGSFWGLYGPFLSIFALFLAKWRPFRRIAGLF